MIQDMLIFVARKKHNAGVVYDDSKCLVELFTSERITRKLAQFDSVHQKIKTNVVEVFDWKYSLSQKPLEH